MSPFPPAADHDCLPWYRSLRFKLVLTAMLVEVIMLGLLLSNSYRLLGEALESQTQMRLDALKPLLNASLAGQVFQRDHSEINAILTQLVKEDAQLSYITVLNSREEPIAHAGKNTPEQVMQKHEDQQALDCFDDLTFDTQLPLTLSEGLVVGKVKFGISLVSLTELRAKVLRQGSVIALIEIIVSLLLLTGIGYLLTRHISALLQGTRRVASADFSQPIVIDSLDEIGLLAADFNHMQLEVQHRIEELAESESRFRTIFDAAGDAFFIHAGETGQLLDVNARMCEMYGCTREEALRLPFSAFISNQPPFTFEVAQEKLQQAVTEGQQVFDWQARRVDTKELFWVEVKLRFVHIGEEGRIIALVRDISERRQHQMKLEFLAHHDPLTQLPNRLLFSDRLEQAIAQARRNQRLLAVVMLDLDGFKSVNDTLGHEIGDRLLILVAQRLKECLRGGDTVCRLGGDEFALLIGDLCTIEEGSLTFQRILESIGEIYRLDEFELHISASVGITVFPFDDGDTDSLMRHADQAMYVSKQSGRNRFHLFDAEHDRLAQTHHDARSRIAEAIEKHEFVMYYQPQIDMRYKCVVGVEALIRWQHPDEGLVPPARFLPLVDDSELAVPLGEWVLDSVLAQIHQWQEAGLRLKVSINISARHLQAPNFFKHLVDRLARYEGIKSNGIALEIVESVALADITKVSRVIDECHALGLSFALDDFGTGYSSLTYFKRLKIDLIKIDQSFVKNLEIDEEDNAIVAGVIGLAQTFRRQVLAEGVETEHLGRLLQDMGCHLLQGYGIARPMPASDVAAWVERWEKQPAWLE